MANLPTKNEFLSSGFDTLAVQEIREEDRKCGICRTPYGETDSDSEIGSEPESPVRIKACGHIFGLDCLKSWIDAGIDSSSQCPTCRAVLFNDDTESPFISLIYPWGDDSNLTVPAEAADRISEGVYGVPPRMNMEALPLMGSHDDRAFTLDHQREVLSPEELLGLLLVTRRVRARMLERDADRRTTIRTMMNFYHEQCIDLDTRLVELRRRRTALADATAIVASPWDVGSEALEMASLSIERLCEKFQDFMPEQWSNLSWSGLQHSVVHDLPSLRDELREKRLSLPQDIKGTRDKLGNVLYELGVILDKHIEGLPRLQQQLERMQDRHAEQVRHLNAATGPWVTLRADAMAINLDNMGQWLVSFMPGHFQYRDGDINLFREAVNRVVNWIREHDGEMHPVNRLHDYLDNASLVMNFDNVCVLDMVRGLIQMAIGFRVIREVEVNGAVFGD
ncbi:uncharacterized protein K452DRAFT_295473 [Aplosporella prunicola CBS 121167]|uniref:RING-type domain-containing protein n=1 Tax=Aplosporella prunicola CBS 121167 TaxID=1176127 RepID=A0A6A6BLB1_9PEZI|nr:uncharacterized protein K452DRAFT_295473 [Aplosporella prunicola CBS 121167]KAF2144900.1 hypothetical protein K452DRAFT_295473 [Aplosporella prunicola CBS 121167]